MIGGLMYLTASRPDIAFATFVCARCKDDCKSTSGGLQFLGGKLVSWSSKKQDCTAMSTACVYNCLTMDICITGFRCIVIPRVSLLSHATQIEYQLADLFTKALPKERFEYLVHRIRMRCITPT
ncbi:hypothetical protein Tco_0119315 [Tanacetum coccineum]